MTAITDREVAEAKDELVWLFVQLADMSREQARDLVDQDPVFNPRTDTERVHLMHEPPYYWVMVTLHGREDPQWFNRPGAWPPPPELWKRYDEELAKGTWQPLYEF